MLYVNPLDSMTSVRTNPESLKAAREDKALQEFERLFLYKLLREMRKTVPADPLLGKSSQKDFFEEMLDDVLAGKMVESGQLGVAKQIEQQLHSRESGHAPIKKAGGSSFPQGG